MHVPEGALLLTYDIVRWYPRITYELCYTLVRRHLHQRGCQYADFIVASLRIALNRNYCLFIDKFYQLFIGFATGISCGGYIATLFVYVLTHDVFRRYVALIIDHDRYNYR